MCFWRENNYTVTVPHLEAGKFKKIDKSRFPNEKLLDQGGSTLKSP